MKRFNFALIGLVLVLIGFMGCGQEPLIYGTMEIPYHLFYSGEGVAYEVDTVSSATPNKWKSDDFTAGTFRAPHTNDQGGDVLGVVYPVGITQKTLDSLGDKNFNFVLSEEVPQVYKLVTVSKGDVSFSQVKGNNATVNATTNISEFSNYGDYQISIDAINHRQGNSDIGRIYGCLLKTEKGSYAMRHLENIWLDELSFSVGFKATESHGNNLSYQNYVSLMGETIKEIIYITEHGYHTIKTNLYVPVKFAGSVEVESAPITNSNIRLTLNNFPIDYDANFDIPGLNFTYTNESLELTNPLAGSYTLTVSDKSSVYSKLRTNFVLTTDKLPVAYNNTNKTIVTQNGFSGSEAQAFLNNIESVTVNGKKYSASGRGAVSIIDKEGNIDGDAIQVSGRGENAVKTPVFAETGNYTLTVIATGHNTPLTFTYRK